MGTAFRDAHRRKAVIDAMVTGESGALDLERALAGAMFDAFTVFQDRQKKYGPNNIAKHREAGVVVRADDKIQRLANYYLRHGSTTADESLEDSWIDLANYGLIGVMLNRNEWPQYEAPDLDESRWNDNGGP